MAAEREVEQDIPEIFPASPHPCAAALAITAALADWCRLCGDDTIVIVVVVVVVVVVDRLG